MSEPSLGSRVVFSHTLVRQTDKRPTPYGRYRYYRHWAPRRFSQSGIVVGVRTLSDGWVDFGSYDEPTTYSQDKPVKAYLVAYHLRRTPVLVLPEHLELVGVLVLPEYLELVGDDDV